MKKYTFILLLIILTFFKVNAHVGLQNPVGGETFSPGQTITISWQELVVHNTLNWDLYFSADGGTTWDILQLDYSVASLSYQWIIPDIITNQARIRVVQDNEDTDYSDDSEDFTISIATESSANLVKVEWSVSPNPFNDIATLSFDNPDHDSYTLYLINSLGRTVRKLEGIDKEQVLIEKGNLPEGLYFFQLLRGPEIQVFGRLVIN